MCVHIVTFGQELGGTRSYLPSRGFPAELWSVSTRREPRFENRKSLDCHQDRTEEHAPLSVMFIK